MITTEDSYICKIVNLLVSNFHIIFVWLTPLSQTKLMQNCSLVHWLSWLPVIHKQALEIKKVKHSDGKENSALLYVENYTKAFLSPSHLYNWKLKDWKSCEIVAAHLKFEFIKWLNQLCFRIELPSAKKLTLVFII